MNYLFKQFPVLPLNVCSEERQELFLSWNVVNLISSFVHRSYLLYTVPFLESWKPVCFLIGEEFLSFLTRVFVSAALAKLRMSILKKPLSSNMCLCLFLCGFLMETGTLPWPELQMYPVYDCV